MSRFTIDSLIERIRRQLSGSIRAEATTLSVAMNNTTTTLQLAVPPQMVRVNSIVSIESELMRVTSLPTASSYTVVRGWNGTPAVAHAAGADVLVNPRFNNVDILDGIINEIDSWEPDLFWVDYRQLDTIDGDQTVMLPAEVVDAIGVIRVRQSPIQGGRSSWPELNFVLQRGPANWPEAGDSGLFIRVTSNSGYTSIGSLQAEVARPFDTSGLDFDTDLSTLQINAGLLELIEMGVKMRMLYDAELTRSQRHAQDAPRNAEEVEAGTAMTAGQMIQRSYDRRRNQEVHRLRARFPMRQW